LVSQFVQNLLEGVSGVFQLAPESLLLYGTVTLQVPKGALQSVQGIPYPLRHELI
jgi:hypothetical protein